MNRTSRGPKLPNPREVRILELLVTRRLYGREIRNLYESECKKSMPLGSLYTTLERMEQKGFIESKVDDAPPVRKGNHRRYFRITGLGANALRARQLMLTPNNGDIRHA